MNASRTHRPSILNFSKCFMIVAGIWRFPLHDPLKIYPYYSAIVQSYFVIICISLAARFALTLASGVSNKSSEEMFKQASYIITVIIVEYAAILYQSGPLKRILSYIMEEERQMLQCTDPEVSRNHFEQLGFCRKSNFIMFIFTCGSGASIALENVWRQLQVHKYNARFNTTLPRPLPLELSYGGWDEEKHFALLLIAHDVWVVISMFLIVSTKTIVFSCVIFVPSILKRLRVKLGKLAESGLRDLVREHQDVIGFVERLNNSLKYLVLLEYILNSLNVATVSVQFITYDPKMLPAPAFYFSFLIAQIFILGWSANEIREQSLALSDALYDSLWYEQSETVRKVLLAMMVRAQKPLALTIGPFEPMTTQSAVTVIKASYSYVTVMMNSYE
ncbi:odorant receptor Or2-like [Cylas formicarius]|uniref:odorant receptor Or2-like n=1 Tax=Cylas formicarius TaxID=197179 RepID=UPI002958DA2A|nr:odorant receptor Or2-like [Cylas formicarius]